jgi:hypothetical protein
VDRGGGYREQRAAQRLFSRPEPHVLLRRSRSGPRDVIDPHVAPAREECPQSVANAYLRLKDNRGRYWIDHFGHASEDADRRRERVHYNMFLASPNHELLYRSKRQLLLSGEFGHVYADTMYYYGREYGDQAISFHVLASLRNMLFEPGTEVPSLPAGLSLDAISLVRVFRHAPGFLVVSADYHPSGGLRAFHVNAVKDGEWTNLPDAAREAGMPIGVTTIGDRSPQRAALGFPAVFRTAEYLQTPRPVWESIGDKEEVNVVNLHYARNRWLVQHVFEAGSLSETRTLRFAVTREDEVLESIDAPRPFAPPSG